MTFRIYCTHWFRGCLSCWYLRRGSENNNTNIVPKSPSLESWGFLSGGVTGGPNAAGGASLISSPLMLTPPWYTAAWPYPSTGYNTIVHQTTGHISNSNTPSSVLNVSVIVVLLRKEEMLPTTLPSLEILWTSFVQRQLCPNDRKGTMDIRPVHAPIVGELIGILLPLRRFCKLKVWLLFLTIHWNSEFWNVKYSKSVTSEFFKFL